MRSDTHAAQTRVSELSPYQEANRLVSFAGGLAFLGQDDLRIWDPARASLRRSFKLDNPRGLGVLSDGSLLCLQAPKDLHGNVRILRVSPKLEESHSQGFVTYPNIVLARILPGTLPEDFFVVSPAAGPYSLEKYHIYGPSDVRIEDSVALQKDDYRTLIRLPDARYVVARERKLLRIAFPKTEVALDLTADIGTVYHLALGPKPGLIWLGDSRSQLHLIRLEPSTVERTIKPGGDLIYQISASGPYVAVLTVANKLGKGSGFGLVVFDSEGIEKWRIALPELGGLGSRFIAAGPNYVAVTGGPDESPALFALDRGQRIQ